MNSFPISETKSDYKKSKDSIGWKTKRGDIYMLCPFHKEKTPSCVLNTRNPRNFICYGCGKTGGLRELSRKTKINILYFKGQIPEKFLLENPELPW